MSSSRRRRLGLAASSLALAGAVAWVALLAPPAPVPRRSVDWEQRRAGPLDARRVYWVGHSLMNHRDRRVDGARNAIEEVGAIATRAGLRYEAFDHTFFGAPLSLNWTGEARTFERREPEALTRRRELEERGAGYDALVLLEALPVGATRRAEAGAYYAQRFACAAARANPSIDVYLFEAWGPYEDDASFRAQIEAERAEHEALADEASAARVPEPGRLAALAPYWVDVEPACDAPPIHLAPVGTAMARLAAAIAREPAAWTTEDGAPLEVSALLANPRTRGALRYPADEPDPIHPSALGAHVAGLVLFATLYRRPPPEGPAPGLSEASAARLRALVWEVVEREPRAGVRPISGGS